MSTGSNETQEICASLKIILKRIMEIKDLSFTIATDFKDMAILISGYPMKDESVKSLAEENQNKQKPDSLCAKMHENLNDIQKSLNTIREYMKRLWERIRIMPKTIIRNLEQLQFAIENKKSVCVPKSNAFNRHTPAAFIMRLPANKVLELFKLGMYEYQCE